MTNRRCLTVILAAGEGTRMRSKLPKALHRIAARSMLSHTVASATEAGADALAVVVGPGHEAVAEEARKARADVSVYVQTERRGTAHAVLAARERIAEGYDDLVVLFCDTPLVRASTIAGLRQSVGEGVAVAVLGFQAKDPTNYGRLLTEDGKLTAIREHKDASDAERRVSLCNAGLMALDGSRALELLQAIGSSNAQNEFYLTDVVEIAAAKGLVSVVREAPEAEVQGVNTRAQLAQAEAEIQRRLRQAAMDGGATLVAPETVFLSFDTRLGEDVVVEPHVVFGPGVTVEDGAVIHAFSHLEGAHVGAVASVGPYARLRPGAQLGRKSRAGNFVEVKNAVVGEGAKINHLTYIGDATIGAAANIGAGTITCNYDGFSKNRTTIGAGAFIGSNSALVAPVTIGEGAYVGSGSVITRDVAPDALAVARGRQVEKTGWAEAFRTAKAKPRGEKA
ncbi:bifunctional protein GlmU [Agaricicola taiwanensis]|uniref:Bifunctional protein GlmU n=1 Tax=Agaricicola taiwanensis TaxID=591372 RepID=A0A8J2YII0_9RHOB|nr:bifunctional UDP-N-acetylglucosamine diphosphorylase/glucosamine-1-phosphate N-acetyltransferase GlmU [Agaricicola taiwanensis]GGE44974.1 bifunctional protein GlmU [Agaricicola taiwanensis]